jgi:hypothetical protein
MPIVCPAGLCAGAGRGPEKGQHNKKPPSSGCWWLICITMAEWTGLEPATPGVTGRYSNQLNYHSARVATLRGFEPRYSP